MLFLGQTAVIDYNGRGQESIVIKTNTQVGLMATVHDPGVAIQLKHEFRKVGTENLFKPRYLTLIK
jgi:hypothetical protein